VPILEVYVCSRCGTQKKVTNHWILALPARTSIEFSQWDVVEARRVDAIHLCGEACAAKELSEFLGRLKDSGLHSVAPQQG